MQNLPLVEEKYPLWLGTAYYNLSTPPFYNLYNGKNPSM